MLDESSTLSKEMIETVTNAFEEVNRAIFHEKPNNTSTTISSYYNDANLYDLINTNKLVNIELLYKLNGTVDIYNNMWDEYRYEDKIDIAYYLTRGQPIHAYFLTQNLNIPLDSKKEDILNQVYSTCFYHLLDNTVYASTICFMEVCGYNTDMLKVNVEAGRRIFYSLQQRCRFFYVY